MKPYITKMAKVVIWVLLTIDGRKIEDNSCVFVGVPTDSTVSPLLFGVQLKFFIEKKSVVANERFAKYFRWLGSPLLRYPGGESSENFHWECCTVDRDDWFWGQSDPEDDLDTDAFHKLLIDYNAKAILAINYKSWLAKGDFEGCCDEAVRWLRYLREIGCTAKYFEFGNEIYLVDSQKKVKITPEQYAEHYTIIRSQLRMVDPAVQVGVCMPPHGTMKPNGIIRNGAKASYAPWMEMRIL